MSKGVYLLKYFFFLCFVWGVCAAFLIASDHSPVGLGLECFPLDTAFSLPSVSLSIKGNRKSNNQNAQKVVNSAATTAMKETEGVEYDMYAEG